MQHEADVHMTAPQTPPASAGGLVMESAEALRELCVLLHGMLQAHADDTGMADTMAAPCSGGLEYIGRAIIRIWLSTAAVCACVAPSPRGPGAEVTAPLLGLHPCVARGGNPVS